MIPMVVVTVAVLLCAFILYSRGKKEYGEYLEGLDKKEWSLRDYLPLGFAMCAASPARLLPKSMASAYQVYKGKVYAKTLLLYGKQRGAEQMYFVYEANKATMAMVVLLLASVFAPLGALANDDILLGYKVLGAGIAAFIAMPFLMDYDLNNKLTKREQELLLQFPAFGSKLVLLLEAGMTVPKAIRKIVADNTADTVLMVELSEMIRSIEGGMAETAAYEEFARRCHVKEINRFVSVLVQSMQKGAQNMSLTLKLQIQECWQARKDLAKTMGQQASTKLVLPLMLMMLGIIFMVGGPALLMFSSM